MEIPSAVNGLNFVVGEGVKWEVGFTCFMVGGELKLGG